MQLLNIIGYDVCFAFHSLYFLSKMEEDSLKQSDQKPFLTQIVNLNLQCNVIELYPAVDDSFFLMIDTWQQGSKQNYLLHCSQASDILWQKKVSSQCKAKMSSEQQAIFTNVKNESVDILNLRTGIIQSITYKFMKKEKDSQTFIHNIQLYIFQKRKLFCLFETTLNIFSAGRSQSLGKLTFFSYEKIKLEPICVFQSQLIPDCWEEDLANFIFQLSGDCKLSWTFSSETLEKSSGLYIFELNQQNAVNFDIVKIVNLEFIDKQSLIMDEDESCDQLKYGLLRELAPNKYLLGARIQLSQLFILNTTAGYDKAVIQNIVIMNNFRSSSKIRNLEVFEQDSFLLLAIQHQIEEQKSVQLIDWHQKAVVANFHLSWNERLSPRLKKGRFFVQYDGKDNYVQIKLIDYQLTLGDGYLHMLLHLNEDFDDDLLQDCITLLQ